MWDFRGFTGRRSEKRVIRGVEKSKGLSIAKIFRCKGQITADVTGCFLLIAHINQGSALASCAIISKLARSTQLGHARVRL